ncbi:DUF4114 domain-containing protein [Wenyingzhuangia sp. chi5]|uniref:DUF4114 domain-containing protein n=1 Tax=Wenyingzhuangia gilva TaxID=3057677 RepID=A0ABT8VMX8_9FLAO|nr:DUF4114 domain-containing protein [Wenyingzhuangia sp. chi5]MDO3693321.1 DUF4114 domain-containing protein [Wenyingzhuangia sp. chi5]
MKPILFFIITFIAVNFGVKAQNYNFLGSYTSDGTPEYLMDVPDEIDEATLTMVHNALPEGYPVPDFNPHYISSGYDTDIHLSERAEVFVTYVTEGAGYKNVLGFYTYNTNDVNVQKPNPEDITIVFPNVSELYSGGSLLPGDKVKIGDFEAGTSIGWVLLADAWKGRVTNGLWQLYSNTDYNPESDEILRSHNVLLEDPENERIILGFEDIRRDYASCDNDFNDAVFYVTATPYRAIVASNINKVSSATDVTSANNGGLESNGTLAEKIAKRNFKRSVKQNLPNTKARQMSVLTYRTMKTSAVNKSVLEEYIPENGMFGTESSYVSSPTDLVDITNADEIYSIDYYQGEHRIAAALASYSSNGVYDHTKAICDRLNSSTLEDVRLVKVRGHQMIHARLLRDRGEVENTLSFSIREAEGNTYELCSYWNIDQYKEGSYYNFQVWGANNGQVFAIANNIIDKFKEKGSLVSDSQTEKIPQVFVKSGYYKNGKIHLQIINNANTKILEFNANIKKTEQSETEQLTQTFQLTGSRLDSIVVDSGYLFDVGVSVKSNTSKQMDALYLADGPWGLDYLVTSAQLNQYDVFQTSEQEISEGIHLVERSIHASGNIKNTLNAFRQVLAGDQSFKLNQYNVIKFESKSTHDVELILMQSDLQDWEDRFSYIVPASKVAMGYDISIHDFKDQKGKSATIEDVKRIVFSINGNGKSFEPFELSIEKVAFTNTAFEQKKLGTDFIDHQQNQVYPNPFSNQTQILVDANMITPTISVYNMAGKLVDQQTIKVSNSNHVIVYQTSLPSGVYLYTIQEIGKNKTNGKFVIKN